MSADRRTTILVQEALNARGAKPPLVVDGWWGAKTDDAMAKLMPEAPNTYAGTQWIGMSFAYALTQVAKGEVGVREQGGNNRGERIALYQQATWLPVGSWPWCAAFVCWAMKQASGLVPVKFSLPQTAGAWDFERWALDQEKMGVALIKPAVLAVQPGDILVYTHSHIGIALTPASGGMCSAIEGNTNGGGGREGDGVYLKQRIVNEIRSIIRIAK